MELLFIDGEVAAISEAPAQSVETTTITEQPAPAAEADAATQQAPEQPAGSGMGFWLMIIAMIAIMYFFMWRPESKRRKQMQKFREGLKKGDKIITAGGIYGVIKEVHETSLLIEVDSNVTLRIDKNMVVGDPTQGVIDNAK